MHERTVQARATNRLHRWQAVHRWSSLICTVFLLLLCFTGLPLIFHDEIDRWIDQDAPYAALPASAPRVNLDRLVEHARQIYPSRIVTSVFRDDDEPQVIVSLAPSWDALRADPEVGRFIRFDARTGQVLEKSKPPAEQRQTFLDLMLRLHIDLFIGLPGQLSLGLMGLLFLMAIISGVVLYGPFTRKLDFGALRANRSRRVRWLDLHNLLGVVTIAWAGVVGATGTLNELSTPLFAIWQRTDVAEMVAPWQGRMPPAQSELSSVQAAFDTTQHALPDMTVLSALYPGRTPGSPYHYLLFTKGNTQLTGRLFSPVLVDARTGELSAIVRMPWYLRAVQISRPLHFGDCGGLPLKILWALLDLVTIVVLGSGLYLWIARPWRQRAAAAREGVHGASPAMEPAE
jgi:uncharacterized iron-regulated membrane protein